MHTHTELLLSFSFTPHTYIQHNTYVHAVIFHPPKHTYTKQLQNHMPTKPNQNEMKPGRRCPRPPHGPPPLLHPPPRHPTAGRRHRQPPPPPRAAATAATTAAALPLPVPRPLPHQPSGDQGRISGVVPARRRGACGDKWLLGGERCDKGQNGLQLKRPWICFRINNQKHRWSSRPRPAGRRPSSAPTSTPSST